MNSNAGIHHERTHRSGGIRSPVSPLPQSSLPVVRNSKLIRVPCIIRPLTEFTGFRQEGAFRVQARYGALMRVSAAHNCSSNSGNYLRIHRENSRPDRTQLANGSTRRRSIR